MIEIFLNIIVAIFLIVLIFFLIEHTLKFRQERLKLEDYRNKVREQEDLDKRTKEHQDKYADGYKYYYWKGYVTLIHTNIFDPGQELYRSTEVRNGEGYFKSEEDLRNCLGADKIKLTWSREL